MSNEGSNQLTFASFYDFYDGAEYRKDQLEMYRSLACEVGSPILDLACGTGIVTMQRGLAFIFDCEFKIGVGMQLPPVGVLLVVLVDVVERDDICLVFRKRDEEEMPQGPDASLHVCCVHADMAEQIVGFGALHAAGKEGLPPPLDGIVALSVYKHNIVLVFVDVVPACVDGEVVAVCKYREVTGVGVSVGH